MSVITFRARASQNKTYLRRGTVIICVLACMLVSTTLIAHMVANSLRNRRECQRGLRQHQTELLLHAGLLRATERLQADANYAGETWQLPEDICGPALVEIETVRDEDTLDTGRAQVTFKLTATVGTPTDPSTVVIRHHECELAAAQDTP